MLPLFYTRANVSLPITCRCPLTKLGFACWAADQSKGGKRMCSTLTSSQQGHDINLPLNKIVPPNFPEWVLNLIGHLKCTDV